MAVTLEDLAAEVNTRSPEDDAPLQRSLDYAVALVAQYVEEWLDTYEITVPDAAMDEAVLKAAVDQFHRRKAPNGILNQTYGDDLTAPVRVGRDPLAAVRPVLAPWAPAGIA